MTARHWPARYCRFCRALPGAPCTTASGTVAVRQHADRHRADALGNRIATEGVTRCFCGVKYWEYDRCVDCGTPAARVLRADPTNC